jgi:hypothetical protein
MTSVTGNYNYIYPSINKSYWQELSKKSLSEF